MDKDTWKSELSYGIWQLEISYYYSDNSWSKSIFEMGIFCKRAIQPSAFLIVSEICDTDD